MSEQTKEPAEEERVAEGEKVEEEKTEVASNEDEKKVDGDAVVVESDEKEGTTETPKKEEEGVFLFHHWLWQHIWQANEHTKFKEMLARLNARAEAVPAAAPAEAEGESASAPVAPQQEQGITQAHFKTLARAWYFVCDVNLIPHAQLEDDCFYPQLKESLEKVGVSTASLDEIESQHPAIEAQMKEITELLAKLAAGDVEESKAQLPDLTSKVTTFFDAYAAHAKEEETTLVPLVRNHMPEADQKVVGLKVKEYVKQWPQAKFALLMFRDTVSVIPTEKDRFENFFPWFLRIVLMNIWSFTDDHYSEYKKLFGSTE
eukprot:TRINITY_DN1322_c0_g2_i3.p1 TRINITY_DN1322_c0_g2~~TRINITY_DN1322_c0_g2_i3.p1  ORF type:complete len:335 (-),score=116.55 TRINITY_DN1322_c0_g2_i3:327-1277(-)